MQIVILNVIRGLMLVQMRNPTGSREGRIHEIARVIKKTVPDIVSVVNIADVYEAVRRLRLSGKYSVRVVATLHGLQQDLLDDLAAEADVIDAVIATNKLSAKLAGQSLNSEERVLYAPYGVPFVDGDVAGERERRRVFSLFYSGRLEQDRKKSP